MIVAIKWNWHCYRKTLRLLIELIILLLIVTLQLGKRRRNALEDKTRRIIKVFEMVTKRLMKSDPHSRTGQRLFQPLLP